MTPQTTPATVTITLNREQLAALRRIDQTGHLVPLLLDWQAGAPWSERAPHPVVPMLDGTPGRDDRSAAGSFWRCPVASA